MPLVIIFVFQADLQHFVGKHFRHQDTKTQIWVERFKVQRSGLKISQPAFIKGIASASFL